MGVSTETCSRLIDQLPVLTGLKRELVRTVPEALLPGLGALGVLAQDGPLRPSALADRLHVDLSVISRQAGQLAAQGLVERLPDPEDRRSHRLRITEDGRTRLAGVREALAGRLAQRLDTWAQRDAETLVQLLTCLRLATEGAPTSPTPGAPAGSAAARGDRA
ncbi:MarR family winged helix-turn-helix transcriptional regulator [Motilibacter aurantiacus]|uniref:MarR family winged helix-turn-helix transcriptional regulator n=1 Tax=Motilibacter aurantiacus TaxID=2714955 RepID=UPI0014074322|nr:MarR family transcriptional regulator [Motilibacter aurantiacus]NHC44300.1 MarR family transcriptional regulator [Motilibacter aurantiacus]